MLRARVLVLAVVVSSCTRDLSLPDPAGAGTVSGRTVVAVVGKTGRQPAAGAKVSLLGSSVSVTTTDTGAFTLEGITDPASVLRFTYDSPQTGPRQLLLKLEGFGAGPTRSISLGDVLLLDNASLRGRALREEIAVSRSGHRGSVVFVPEGPYTTFTADDGTFLLTELPDGPIQLSVFREGYAPSSVSQVALRSGEETTLADLILSPLTGTPAPGSISGTLRLQPAGAFTGCTATASSITTSAGESASADTGSFTLAGLAPGVYDVRAFCPGYTTAVLANVLVRGGEESLVRELVLAAGPAGDAGVDRPDAGPLPDGGTMLPDAGPGDGGTGSPCTTVASCGPLQWCDRGFCRPQCTSSAQCDNSRICELATGTCVLPCTATCPAPNQQCHPGTGLCRETCGLGFPCEAGRTCTGGLCVPQCSVNQDCGSPHLGCTAGACLRLGTCDSDRDCAADTICLAVDAGTPFCRARITALDAGAYVCESACDCRLDEVCELGACLPAVVPTRYLSADGGGNGLTPATPSSSLQALASSVAPGSVLALREGDTFVLAAGLSLDAGIAVQGGYTDCGLRWVRSGSALTTLEATNVAVPVVKFAPSTAMKLSGAAARNLQLRQPAVSTSCYGMLLDVSGTTGFVAEHLSGEYRTVTASCSPNRALLRCAGCDQLRATGLTLLPSVSPASNAVAVVSLQSSSGSLSDLLVKRTTLGDLAAVEVFDAVGDVTVDGVVVEEMTAIGGLAPGPRAIDVRNCGGATVNVSNVRFAWPVAQTTSNIIFPVGVYANGCPKLFVTAALIDGSATVGFATRGTGIQVINSGGELTNNEVRFPTSTGFQGVPEVTGFHLIGPNGDFVVTGNHTRGGQGLETLTNMKLENVTQGALKVEHNDLTGGQVATSAVGLKVMNVSAAVGLTVRENNVVSGQGGKCSGSTSIIGLDVTGSAGRFERNTFWAPSGVQYLAAARVGFGSAVELYSNHLWAGVLTGVCAGSAEFGLELPISTASFVNAIGNTIEAEGELSMPTGTRGVSCADHILFMTSNLVGGGAGGNAGATAVNTPIMLQAQATGTCFSDPSRFHHNYFFYARPGVARASADQVGRIATGMPGVPDSNGNIIGDLVSCLDIAVPSPRSVLSPTSPCIDTGDAGFRSSDGSPITQSLDGGPRVLGLGPDIGCTERR